VADRTEAPSDLIRAVRAGDRRALDGLLESYRHLLRLLARASLDGALGGKADASDVVQDTLIRAHDRFDQFRGSTEGELVAWLKRILSHTVVDVHRRFLGNGGRALVRERSLDALLDRPSRALDGLLPANATTPSQGAATRERSVLLAEALETLPPDHREVVVLRSLRELEWGEVGRLMGRSPDAARVMWGRAVRGLGRALRGAP
jgi:RNA polymerase sigma-70 factor (ECF subfamily)